MTNEIALQKQSAYSIANPKSFEEAMRIASVLAASDMVPKDFKGKPENCLIAMQWGLEIGLPGLQALQNIAVINGRPSIWGDAAKALCIASPNCEDIKEFVEGDGDSMVAVCIAKRKNKAPIEQRFSVDDAKKAGLWGKQGPWQNYPKRMLQMRARGFALRDAFPDSLRGISIAEEQQDLVEIDVTTGEITKKKPSAEAGRPSIEYYSDEKFQENKEKWKAIVLSGGKTVDGLINFIQSKALLTDEQKAEINSWGLLNNTENGAAE